MKSFKGEDNLCHVSIYRPEFLLYHYIQWSRFTKKFKIFVLADEATIWSRNTGQ